MRSHIGWRGNETFLYKGVKPLPSRRVKKTLRGSLEGKAQIGQYLLVVGLGCYKWYQSQASGAVSARTLGPQWGVACEISYWLERERNISYKGVKPLPSRCILKL